MKRVRHICRGFTIAELVVAVGIVALLAAVAIPSYATLRSSLGLKNAARELAGALRKAQSQAMTSQGGVVHGVHVEAGRFCSFAGGTFTSCSSPYYTLRGLTVAGGVGDITFARLTGAPASSTSIVLQAVGGASQTVAVEQSGRIYLP